MQAKLYQSLAEVATEWEWKDGLSVFEGDKTWIFFCRFLGSMVGGDTNELGAMLVGQPISYWWWKMLQCIMHSAWWIRMNCAHAFCWYELIWLLLPTCLAVAFLSGERYHVWDRFIVNGQLVEHRTQLSQMDYWKKTTSMSERLGKWTWCAFQGTDIASVLLTTNGNGQPCRDMLVGGYPDWLLHWSIERW